MELIQVDDCTPAGSRGEQFSLVFEGPPEPPLEQRIYELRHEALGRLELFLVPVGARRHRRQYEAFFNLLPRSDR